MAIEQAMEHIKKRMDVIDKDERFHYEPANVFINAPLALIQVELETEMRTLKAVKAELEK